MFLLLLYFFREDAHTFVVRKAAKFRQKTGDPVAVGDILFAYETDKAAFEEEAKEAGQVLAIFFEEGDDVPCLTNVMVIGSAGPAIKLPEASE